MTTQPLTPRVLSIATALPSHVCTREQSIAIARQVFHEQPEALAFLERLLNASGIEQRYTAIADYGVSASERTFFPKSADFRPEPGSAARNQLFEREANVLAIKACGGLGGKPWQARVTHLVTASCTGFTAPGFDIALVRALGLSPRVHRTHVGFMGCYAGFSTLKLANTICQADPNALVLVVHVELCSLHVHFSPDVDTLIANSLFADGVAAALVGTATHAGLVNGTPLLIKGAGAFLLPNGEEDMTWRIGDTGFHMTLSPRVPFLLHKHLPAAFETLLQELKVDRAAIKHWAIHPGGPAILDKAVKALDLQESDVGIPRDVLRTCGNMSSATLWFILDRIRALPAAGAVYACGFGPGLTLESALLEHPGAL
ncbi:MAG: type III polyketide synthase [Deltaproteobacteria bacterium]|nr:type III polyketide synthase [Deltaproteobacteria bacterium]